jgi:chemotaxis protein CheC
MAHLGAVATEDVASVHQAFTGAFAGDALMILDPAAAATLERLLTDEPSLPLKLDASSREVLTEVGNILLNACLGTFGNLLEVPINFAVPEINVASLHSAIERLAVGQPEELRIALVVTSGFRLLDAEIVGYLVIVLSVTSLTRLLVAVEGWERSQV